MPTEYIICCWPKNRYKRNKEKKNRRKQTKNQIRRFGERSLGKFKEDCGKRKHEKRRMKLKKTESNNEET